MYCSFCSTCSSVCSPMRSRRSPHRPAQGAGIVARVVIGVLTAPISALAASVLYFELGGQRPSSRLGATAPAQTPNPFGGP